MRACDGARALVLEGASATLAGAAVLLSGAVVLAGAAVLSGAVALTGALVSAGAPLGDASALAVDAAACAESEGSSFALERTRSSTKSAMVPPINAAATATRIGARRLLFAGEVSGIGCVETIPGASAAGRYETGRGICGIAGAIDVGGLLDEIGSASPSFETDNPASMIAGGGSGVASISLATAGIRTIGSVVLGPENEPPSSSADRKVPGIGVPASRPLRSSSSNKSS